MEEPARVVAVPDHGPPAPLPGPEEGIIQKRHSLSSRPNVAARHAKRLTLNFPIVPPPNLTLNVNLRPENSSPSIVAETGAGTPTESPRMMPPGQSLPDAIAPGEEADEPIDLLTAIASQERKVLELKEELQRAEAELSSLKRQWVRSERQKKQTEISHHAEAMRPLRIATTEGAIDQSSRTAEDSNATAATTTTTATTTPIDSTPAQIRRSKELERRNSIRTAAKGDTSISANGRRVFAGSRHTRTLSLLSPDMGVVKQPFPMKNPSEQSSDKNETQTTRHPRSATLPSVERTEPLKPQKPEENSTEENQWRRSLPPPSSEALLRTGRQMASDLREGLWTFLEDIRQATVGEEAISANRTRSLQPPVSNSPRSRSGQRTERSVTPVRRREQNGTSSAAAATVGRTNSSSSLSKEASNKTGKNNSLSSNNITTPADTDVSFWSEFGVDTPEQKLKPNQVAVAATNTPNGQKESENSNCLEVDEDDDWSNWDTPQPNKKSHSHTPSSSQSTMTSNKNDQSPSSRLSSPRTSASFGERNTEEKEQRPRTANTNIPWPALSKFTPSRLSRTASSLMDEWEKSLTSSTPSSAVEPDDEWDGF